jgi:hypothetical protein
MAPALYADTQPKYFFDDIVINEKYSETLSVIPRLGHCLRTLYFSNLFFRKKAFQITLDGNNADTK